MINKIIGRGFKGLDFTEEIDSYNLLVGPNGVGKSARTQALTIAILGYLPSDGFKQPGMILANHGTGPEMKVGFERNGDRFVRHFQRGKDGTIHQDVTLNGKKLNSKEIIRKLIDLGNPRIFDLKAFNDSSEAKKIEFILELFPPTGDLKKLDREISKIEQREKFFRSEIGGKKMVIEQLTKERSMLELPSGSLAEIQEEIGQKETELSELRDEIKQIEVDQAKEAAQKVWEDAESKRKEESPPKDPSEESDTLPFMEEKYVTPEGQDVTDKVNQLKGAVGREKKLQPQFPFVVESLLKIKETMASAGCDACAAMIVLNAEIKEWKGGHRGPKNAQR